MAKHVPIVLILLGLAFSVAAQAPSEKRMTVLDVLKVGQKVGLNEVAGRFEIRFLEGIDDVQEYVVKTIEADHLVMDDVTEVNRLFIPTFSISSIRESKKLSGTDCVDFRSASGIYGGFEVQIFDHFVAPRIRSVGRTAFDTVPHGGEFFFRFQCVDVIQPKATMGTQHGTLHLFDNWAGVPRP